MRQHLLKVFVPKNLRVRPSLPNSCNFVAPGTLGPRSECWIQSAKFAFYHSTNNVILHNWKNIMSLPFSWGLIPGISNISAIFFGTMVFNNLAIWIRSSDPGPTSGHLKILSTKVRRHNESKIKLLNVNLLLYRANQNTPNWFVSNSKKLF